MVGCAAFYTAETTLIRWIGPGWPAPVTLLWREVAAIALLLPFVVHQRGKPLRTRQWRWLTFRSLTGTAGLILSIYAIARLPLAISTTLSFTRPLWIMIIAWLVLGESFGARKVVALFLGIVGVLWIAQPAAALPDLSAAAASIGAALLFAASIVSIRFMTATETPLTIMFYGQALGLAFTAPLAIWSWRAPDAFEALILLSVGVLGLGTMACHVKALQAAEASVVGPYEYLRLPFAMLAGLVLLGEVPGWIGLVGAAVILSAALVAAGKGGVQAGSEEPKPDADEEFHLPPDADWTTKRIRAVFEEQLRAEVSLAAAHMRDPYWTDSRTGHNIGHDELAAVRFMESISLEPTAEENDDPELYAGWILRQLDVVAERFRMEAPDPDGYGIATIGTVKRKLRQILMRGE